MGGQETREGCKPKLRAPWSGYVMDSDGRQSVQIPLQKPDNSRASLSRRNMTQSLSSRRYFCLNLPRLPNCVGEVSIYTWITQRMVFGNGVGRSGIAGFFGLRESLLGAFNINIILKVIQV